MGHPTIVMQRITALKPTRAVATAARYDRRLGNPFARPRKFSEKLRQLVGK